MHDICPVLMWYNASVGIDRKASPWLTGEVFFFINFQKGGVILPGVKKHDMIPEPIPKVRTAPGKRRITNKMREEITIYYYSHKITQKQLGELYDIPQSSVNGIVNNPKWMKKAHDYLDNEMKRGEIMKKMTLLKAIQSAPDAMEQIIKIAMQEVKKDNMGVQYVIQNACNEILNRAGIKPVGDEANEIVIRFADPTAAFEPGVPELEASEMIDVTDSAPEGSDSAP